LLLHDPFPQYLAPTPEIDFDHPSIQALLDQSGWRDLSEVERTRSAFEYVRDEIRHSWDAQDTCVTCAASEVLEHRTSLCYGKSHLLAALLRGLGIPAGICYQRLVLFEDPADGFSVHALNAAYLAGEDRWIRFDARGNKPGVDAQFSLDGERLAFVVRPELEEIDYPGTYASPSRVVVGKLRSFADAKDLYANGLPDRLD
jgi:transglutaminase-like putative cysteine protease